MVGFNVFFFKQRTAYEITVWLEFRRVLFRSARFSLRQRPWFLYWPFLVAAAPRLFILPISRCGSAPLFILPGFRCGSPPGFYTALFSLQQRPTFYTVMVLIAAAPPDRKSTRLNSSHTVISYAVFCLKKKKKKSFSTSTCSKSHIKSLNLS